MPVSSSSISSSPSISTTALESAVESESTSFEEVEVEDPITGEITTVQLPKPKTPEAKAEYTSDDEKSTLMTQEEVNEIVDEIAEAVTGYATEIFRTPEFKAEVVEDIPDPKIFLTEDGQVRTRVDIFNERIRIDSLEVPERLASCVRCYVQAFDVFNEFVEQIPDPQLFLDHDGIVRSGAELLANRRKVKEFVIERVDVVPVSKDYASMELLSTQLKGMKLVQAVRKKLEELKEENEEDLEPLPRKFIDPTGFQHGVAEYVPGRGGLDAPLARKTSEIPADPLILSDKHTTRFFRVTRGHLAEADHAWTPETGERVAFVVRYPQSGPNETEIMELMTRLERGQDITAPTWKSHH